MRLLTVILLLLSCLLIVQAQPGVCSDGRLCDGCQQICPDGVQCPNCPTSPAYQSYLNANNPNPVPTPTTSSNPPPGSDIPGTCPDGRKCNGCDQYCPGQILCPNCPTSPLYQQYLDSIGGGFTPATSPTNLPTTYRPPPTSTTLAPIRSNNNNNNNIPCPALVDFSSVVGTLGFCYTYSLPNSQYITACGYANDGRQILIHGKASATTTQGGKGLGITGDPSGNYGIDHSSFIQLDLRDVPEITSITMSGISGSDYYQFYGSNKPGRRGILLLDNGIINGQAITLPSEIQGYRFLSITCGDNTPNANVLISNIKIQCLDIYPTFAPTTLEPVIQPTSPPVTCTGTIRKFNFKDLYGAGQSFYRFKSTTNNRFVLPTRAYTNIGDKANIFSSGSGLGIVDTGRALGYQISKKYYIEFDLRQHQDTLVEIAIQCTGVGRIYGYNQRGGEIGSVDQVLLYEGGSTKFTIASDYAYWGVTTKYGYCKVTYVLIGCESPTSQPTYEPTYEPTFEPTYEPTLTLEPTLEPTYEPTYEPTLEPTSTLEPTFEPTYEPTLEPTLEPTFEPTYEPTAEPSTLEPTFEPTLEPTTCINDFVFNKNLGNLGHLETFTTSSTNPNAIKLSTYAFTANGGNANIRGTTGGIGISNTGSGTGYRITNNYYIQFDFKNQRNSGAVISFNSNGDISIYGSSTLGGVLANKALLYTGPPDAYTLTNEYRYLTITSADASGTLITEVNFGCNSAIANANSLSTTDGSSSSSSSSSTSTSTGTSTTSSNNNGPTHTFSEANDPNRHKETPTMATKTIITIALVGGFFFLIILAIIGLCIYRSYARYQNRDLDLYEIPTNMKDVDGPMMTNKMSETASDTR